MATATAARTRINFQKLATDQGGNYWTAGSATAGQLRAHIKQAAIGGEQEQGFEQAFSSLAYAMLKDKSPRLLDFIVGFQLVDRDEDNTKAVGVFGFKVGKEWLYAPVFFLNGDLKGHELLYIKNQDVFVPMAESWVNYVLARKPHMLGEQSQKDVFQLGGLSPNINRLSTPPSWAGKYGSDKQAGMPGMGMPSPTGPANDGLTNPPDPKRLGTSVVPPASTGGSAATGLKAAAQYDEWFRPVAPMFAACRVKSARFLHRNLDGNLRLDMSKVAADPYKIALAGNDIDLNEILSANIKMAHAAWNASRRYPLIKRAFDRFYGTDFFQNVVTKLKAAADLEASSILGGPGVVTRAKRASEIELIPAEKKASAASKLQIITRDDPWLKTASDEDKKKILHHGYLVKDERTGEQISTAYSTQTRLEMVNPGETGLYEILEKPGKFSKMLVVASPFSNKGNRHLVTVVRTGGGREWVNSAQQSVWASKQHEAQDFRDWWDGIPAGRDLKKGGVYLGISGTGQGTVPFKVTGTYPGDDDTYTLYKVDFLSNTREVRPMHKRHVDTDDRIPGPTTSFPSHDARLVVTNRRGAKIHPVSGELHVPSDFKFFKLEEPQEEKPEDENIGSLLMMSGHEREDLKKHDPAKSQSKESPILPGDMTDIQLMINRSTDNIKLSTDQHETVIYSKAGTDRYSGRSALFALVRNHGFSEKQAKDMLKAAAARRPGVSFRVVYGDEYPLVKSADLYPGLGAGPTAPNFPSPYLGTEPRGYNSVNAIYPQEEQIPVSGLEADRTDPRIYDPFLMPDKDAVNTAQQAGAQGQKEVFDTSMLTGMLKTVRQEGLVDKYLPSLMKALDNLGRILFSFYWHQADFEERYGKDALPELEDSLRNNFEAIGEIVLYLREKAVGDNIDSDQDPSIEDSSRN